MSPTYIFDYLGYLFATQQYLSLCTVRREKSRTVGDRPGEELGWTRGHLSCRILK